MAMKTNKQKKPTYINYRNQRPHTLEDLRAFDSDEAMAACRLLCDISLLNKKKKFKFVVQFLLAYAFSLTNISPVLWVSFYVNRVSALVYSTEQSQLVLTGSCVSFSLL